MASDSFIVLDLVLSDLTQTQPSFVETFLNFSLTIIFSSLFNQFAESR